jgi:excisionase family DNA binding protein
VSAADTLAAAPAEGKPPGARKAGAVMAGETSDVARLGEVRFLTVAEVAAMMRVSKMTVYRLLHSGDLPAARVGRSLRVPQQAVDDYLRRAFIEAG